MALSIKRDVFHNHYSMNIFIEKSRMKDSHISIEARAGTQDFQQVMNTVVDFSLFREVDKEFHFTDTISLIELLSYSIEGSKIDLPTKLIALLQQGGAK